MPFVLDNSVVTAWYFENQAFKRLAAAVARIVGELQEAIRPYVEKVTGTSNRLRIEMNKLGMG